MHENCTPSHHLHLKQITASQVLRASAAGRTPFAATEIAKSVVVGVDRKQGNPTKNCKSQNLNGEEIIFRWFGGLHFGTHSVLSCDLEIV